MWEEEEGGRGNERSKIKGRNMIKIFRFFF